MLKLEKKIINERADWVVEEREREREKEREKERERERERKRERQIHGEELSVRDDMFVGLLELSFILFRLHDTEREREREREREKERKREREEDKEKERETKLSHKMSLNSC